MKIVTTITADEKNNTLDGILFDPCTYIHCGEIDCNDCPLHTVTEALRKAQEDYEKAINKMIVKG